MCRQQLGSFHSYLTQIISKNICIYLVGRPQPNSAKLQFNIFKLSFHLSPNLGRAPPCFELICCVFAMLHICFTDTLSALISLRASGLSAVQPTTTAALICWPLTLCAATCLGATSFAGRAAGVTIGRRILTCRFDDENAPCSAFDKCDVCRSSLQSTLQSTTISIRNATSTHETISSSIEPLLLLSGANY